MKRTSKHLCFLLLMLLGTISTTVMAQNLPTRELRMKFDFETVTDNGIVDPISGTVARTYRRAEVIELGGQHVLSLGTANGYLNLTSAAGTILSQLQDFTLSAYYRVNKGADLSTAGHYLFTFANNTSCTETAGKYLTYRLNAQRLASSTAGWGSETGLETGRQTNTGRWVHMVYRQKGTRGQLIIDGSLVAQADDRPSLHDLFPQAPSYCWIGRPAFADDNYLKNTLVDNICIYGTALTDTEVAQMAAITNSLENGFRYGVAGDFTELRSLADEASILMNNSEGYAPNALAQLQVQLDLVQKECAAQRATQAYIDEMVIDLKAVINKVKATAGYTPRQPREFTAGQQGFVHPGALVTQADIDRAKKMIFDDKNEYMVRAWQILCDNQWSRAGTATWPTVYVQRGLSGDNYMNAARAAHCAFQNALRWKIGGDRANADWAVQTMMNWCNVTEAVTGNTNISLAAGLYGYEFANAAELMRDYDGWAPEDFERFKRWMVKVWYNPAIDFLRRRHDTWMNFRHPECGERPGHYWSNWGLCNALCVMSIGILCDDVHMYNQGVSFYKYDHQGTFVEDRTQTPMIYNDGCNEFIGNLVPITMPDARGPFGFLGQMQESGRDQGHAVMALGCALDICQVGFNQGDDLYAYMNDRIAAGAEYVAALNFAGLSGADLPWYPYEYADCAGVRGASWQMFGPNEGGKGERRPMWDRVRGYYEGLRGVKMQYSDAAAAVLCPDGGGGNYNANSGGYDHLGFTTLTSWRPAIDKADAITPLSGDIVYKGETLKNQTNLGGLKYKYWRGETFAIPADGAEITLIPQLPEGVTDTGLWKWETGETTRQLTVHADKSYIYRVTYTAANGKQSQQSFAIAVAGDAEADLMVQEITVNGVIERTAEKAVLSGSDVILYAEGATGWTDDYLWDDGTRGTVTTVENVTSDRDYTCQFRNQSGAVSEAHFHLTVLQAIPYIDVNGTQTEGTEALVFEHSDIVLRLMLPSTADEQDVVWSDGTHGATHAFNDLIEALEFSATYLGEEYHFSVNVKDTNLSYYNILAEDGFSHITELSELNQSLSDSYFVLCSDEDDLMLGLANAPMNGNKALFYQKSCSPLTDFLKLYTIEPFDNGYCLRNVDYDGLLLQTEMNAPWNLRTHDQPYACSWARLLMNNDGGSWTIQNGTYPGNWLGLWAPENGYHDGEELACNKSVDAEIGHFQLFAINKAQLHHQLLADATESDPVDATVLVLNPSFEALNWALWTVQGTFGNQRFNGAAETWHSTGFKMQQTMTDMPAGRYVVTVQMANGEGVNTGYLFASTSAGTEQAVVKQSCAGSDFDTQRNRMNSNSNYGLLSVEALVGEDGVLTFGIAEPTNDTTWLVFDNFTLTYYGQEATGINTLSTKNQEQGAIYDLMGRKVQTPAKGFYIVGGKKVFIP